MYVLISYEYWRDVIMSSSLEDLLIKEYQKKHQGKLYKEVSVGKVENKMRQRKIDGILIEGDENRTYEQGEYNLSEVKKEIKGAVIHLIEAKRILNRTVIGQVEVGEYLVKEDFSPEKIIPIALCANSHSDIEDYCKQKNIKVVIYNVNSKDSDDSLNDTIKEKDDKSDNSIYHNNINDIRSIPDRKKYTAFKRGWEDAIQGKLYDSVRDKKTHTNMGNLFGWIYGECPDDLKKKVWEDYKRYNTKYLDKQW